MWIMKTRNRSSRVLGLKDLELHRHIFFSTKYRSFTPTFELYCFHNTSGSVFFGSCHLIEEGYDLSGVHCDRIVGCLASQQHVSVSRGRIYIGNFTCCHTEI